MAKRYTDNGGGGFSVDTYDLSVQHRFAWGTWNDITWGAEDLSAALGAAAMMTPGTAMASDVLKPGSKPWRGLYPVAQTPFTPDNKLDLDCLECGACCRARRRQGSV